MNAKQAKEMHRWAVSFAAIVNKVRQGMDTPGSAITLNQQECKDLAYGLQALTKPKAEGDG